MLKIGVISDTHAYWDDKYAVPDFSETLTYEVVYHLTANGMGQSPNTLGAFAQVTGIIQKSYIFS